MTPDRLGQVWRAWDGEPVLIVGLSRGGDGRDRWRVVWLEDPASFCDTLLESVFADAEMREATHVPIRSGWRRVA